VAIRLMSEMKQNRDRFMIDSHHGLRAVNKKAAPAELGGRGVGESTFVIAVDDARAVRPRPD
jgi:hypothetical protein